VSGFVKGNWGLKLLSLLLAVVLWVYVANEQNPLEEQQFKSIPVAVRGVGSNLVVSQQPGTVNLKVQAKQNIISELRLKTLEAFIDLSGLGTGKHSVLVQVKVPADVKVTDLTPDRVDVTLEQIIEKQVPVKLRTVGSPGEGYKVLAMKVKPEEIIVRGPKSMVDRVGSASVEVVLGEKTRSFGETLPVKISDKSGRFLDEKLINRTPQVAEILVSIVHDMPAKTVRVVPRITGQPAPGFTVTMTAVDPPELIITGSRDAVSQINEVSTQPVDISGATADIYVDAAPQLPPGVTANRESLRVLVKIGQ